MQHKMEEWVLDTIKFHRLHFVRNSRVILYDSYITKKIKEETETKIKLGTHIC